MESENILKLLHGGEVDQSELEQILMYHFGRGAAVTPRQIEYRYAEGGPPAVTLLYDAHSELQAIQAGSALRADAIADLQKKIQESLLTPTKPITGQQILFAHVPTNGYFRYKELFQLSPVPAEAPRPPFMLGDHPLVLEFQFKDSPDATVRIQRQMRTGHEIELLCVALVMTMKGSLGKASHHHWVIPQNPDPAALKSQFCQELYTWPQAPRNHDGFSPHEGVAPIARTTPNVYYTSRGISVGQDLDLPQNLEVLLDSFFGLHRDAKDQFLRGGFWFRHAQRVFTYSQSACFTALVNAIEALMGPSGDSEKCVTCGKATGPGPTKRFVDFVEEHAPSPQVPGSERRKFYTLRSALSHGGKLLPSDHAIGWPALTPDTIGQRQDMDAMWQIVRIALVNWLVLKSNRP